MPQGQPPMRVSVPLATGAETSRLPTSAWRTPPSIAIHFHTGPSETSAGAAIWSMIRPVSGSSSLHDSSSAMYSASGVAIIVLRWIMKPSLSGFSHRSVPL